MARVLLREGGTSGWLGSWLGEGGKVWRSARAGDENETLNQGLKIAGLYKMRKNDLVDIIAERNIKPAQPDASNFDGQAALIQQKTDPAAAGAAQEKEPAGASVEKEPAAGEQDFGKMTCTQLRELIKTHFRQQVRV